MSQMQDTPYTAPLPPNPHGGEPPEKKGLSGCAIAGIGCGIAAVLALIVIVVLAVVGGRWFMNAGPGFATDAMVEQVQNSPLPADEQQAFVVRLEQIKADYEAGTIDLTEWAQEFEAINNDLVAAVQAHGGTPPSPPAPDADAGAPGAEQAPVEAP